jgi:hypothetical protein
MTRQEILASMQSGEITLEEADVLLGELESSADGKLYAKTSRNGALCVYGLQRMPVTLYVQQWLRLLAGCPADHFVLAHIRADKPQYHPPQYEKDKVTGEQKLIGVSRITRLAKGRDDKSFVLVDQPESESGKAEMAELGFTLTADGKVTVKAKANA